MVINMGICFETKRLLLRELTQQDLPELVRIAGQPHVARWLPDWADCAAWVQDWFQGVQEGYRLGNPEERFILLAVEEKGSRSLVGQASLGRECEEYGPGELGVGCFMAEEVLNRGYAAEAVAALLDYARSSWGCGRFAAVVKPGNIASARMLEKNGFREQGLLILTVEGKPAEFCLYRNPGISAGTAPPVGAAPELTAKHCRSCGMVFPHGMKQCPICGALLSEVSGDALKRLRS